MAKGKLLKFPKRLRVAKDFDLYFGKSLNSFRLSAGNALSADRRMRPIKVAKNTFSASRKNFLKKSKGKYGILSLDLHTKGLAKSFGSDTGVALTARRNIEMFRAGQLKKLTKMRRESGRGAVKAKTQMDRLVKPRSDSDRLVNARGKGITFRKIGGRIVPIRPRRKK